MCLPRPVISGTNISNRFLQALACRFVYPRCRVLIGTSHVHTTKFVQLSRFTSSIAIYQCNFEEGSKEAVLYAVRHWPHCHPSADSYSCGSLKYIAAAKFVTLHGHMADMCTRICKSRCLAWCLDWETSRWLHYSRNLQIRIFFGMCFPTKIGIQKSERPCMNCFAACHDF